MMIKLKLSDVYTYTSCVYILNVVMDWALAHDLFSWKANSQASLHTNLSGAEL